MYTEDELNEMGLSVKGKELLLHYGTKYRSGRYPWGSGQDPYQRARTETDIFEKARVHYKEKGLSDNDIAKKFGISVPDYRKMVTLASNERKQRIAESVKSGLERGESRKELAERLGISLASVDNYAKDEYSVRNRQTQSKKLVDSLKNKVDEVEYLDISAGVELQLGVSKERLRSAVKELEDSGDYTRHKIQIQQVTNNSKKTTINVMTKSDKDIYDVYENAGKIRPVDFHFNGGLSGNLQNTQVPESVDWNRVKIKYAIPEGQKGHGTDADGAMSDGAMFIRPGVKDLDMGNAKYAQVRIAVGGSHYLKGMALYGDPKDFPKGADIIFNTNKTADVSKEKVLKELKSPLDGMEPFGATIKRQAYMKDDKGNYVINEKATKALQEQTGDKSAKVYKNGAINIVNEDGDWQNWSKSLSSQFLSKQPDKVVHERLKQTLKDVDDELDTIMKIDNPVVRKKLLENYSDSLEGRQVHLKASAPKGFQGHVILPVPKMKENEVFAPNYPDGTRVILVRYPHGGTFEIPELIVNNNNVGKKMIGKDSRDAIGINPKVAGKLSGADFDGDTVYVIPNNSGKFKSSKSLKALENFDPGEFKDPKGTFKPMKKGSIQMQMGMASNLITDMTLKKATPDEMARAVKHSMVVIDAHKHELNYKRSEEVHGIQALREKYQSYTDNIDYSKLERYDRNTRKVERVIDPAQLKKGNGSKHTAASNVLSRHAKKVVTGGKFVEIPTSTGGTKTVIRGKSESYVTTMLKDASVYLNKDSTYVEKEYVNYINELKSRKPKLDSMIDSISMPKRDPKAAIIYTDEVKSLERKLKVSKLNAPKERQAQLLAREKIKATLDEVGGRDAISNEDYKRIKTQALNGARLEVGAKRNPVDITDDEWDAIQANAISPTKLKELLDNMNDDQLKRLASPKSTSVMSDTKKAKAKQLLDNGYSLSEVANALGVSPSTISRVKSEE